MQTTHRLEHKWWEGRPVLEVTVEGGISTREEAFTLADTIVTQIEQSVYRHVIVILDLTSLGGSPSGATLIGGNLPKTLKIEHLIMVNAPSLLKVVTMPLFMLRNKLHYVESRAEANKKANDLMPRLPKQ
jgi:hypothetical protein